MSLRVLYSVSFIYTWSYRRVLGALAANKWVSLQSASSFISVWSFFNWPQSLGQKSASLFSVDTFPWSSTLKHIYLTWFIVSFVFHQKMLVEVTSWNCTVPWPTFVSFPTFFIFSFFFSRRRLWVGVAGKVRWRAIKVDLHPCSDTENPLKDRHGLFEEFCVSTSVR